MRNSFPAEHVSEVHELVDDSAVIFQVLPTLLTGKCWFLVLCLTLRDVLRLRRHLYMKALHCHGGRALSRMLTNFVDRTFSASRCPQV
jgi:hypothetical protein